MSTEKRKPTWTICVNDAPQGVKPHWREIGAAWETQSGNLFIKMEDSEVLRGTAMMFPYREKPVGGYHRPFGGSYRQQAARSRTDPSPEARLADYGVATSSAPPAAPLPATAPEPDYMERKRTERRSPTPSSAPKPPQPVAPEPPADDLPYDEGIEPPKWLE